MLREFSFSQIPSKFPIGSKKKTLNKDDLENIRTSESTLINKARRASQGRNDGKSSWVYIINNAWLDSWNLFINKQGPRPGIISNVDLLDDNKHPKKGLNNLIHYKGLGKCEWEIFYQAYGGGPVIIRNAVDIYAEPVIPPSIKTRMKRRVSDVSESLKEKTAQTKIQMLKFKEDSNARMTMTGEIKSAVESLRAILNPEKYLHHQEHNIPLYLIKNAKGFAFITEIKAGFLFSGKCGSGIVIARCNSNESGWSGPSCFGFTGIGAGFMAGVSRIKTMMVLNKDSAVNVFKGKGQFKLGGDLEVAVGPVGRNVSGDIRYSGGFAPCYSYSHSKGLYAGISIDGTIVVARNDENSQFYSKKSVTPKEILDGTVKIPRDNRPLSELYAILKKLDKKAHGTVNHRPQRPQQWHDKIELGEQDVEEDFVI